MYIFILAMFFVDSVFHLYNIKMHNKRWRSITKALLMPLLLAYYIAASKNSSILVMAAIIGGFIGDVFLLKDNKPIYLTLGLLSFLTGHVFYILMYINISAGIAKLPLWSLALIVPYIIYGVLIYSNLYKNLGTMKAAVAVYLIILLTMSFTCAVVLASGKLFLIPAFIGSLSFVASDTILAVNIFKSRKKDSDIIIMSTYIVAQFLIVSALL